MIRKEGEMELGRERQTCLLKAEEVDEDLVLAVIGEMEGEQPPLLY